uniref:ATP synthase subunit a n=1 Tax=Cressida cressida TaxID=95570 RepID=A0A5J6WEG3_9NEOP|nr:ATP synthase F0 subunit 6 [Cressida cressida]
MMTNLFSIFDPSTNIFNFQLNWISAFIVFFYVPLSFWLIPNRQFILWNLTLLKFHNEFKIFYNNNKNFNGSTLIFISLFYLILFNNFLSLFPYIFNSTSHMSFSLSISFSLWLSFILYGWINNYQHMFIHLIPQGTPTVLLPFMVMIETISNLIRPSTLAIRLSANMTTGHILLTLLGNASINMPIYLLFILIFIQILLFILEMAVAIIQSYVFSILMNLYSSEIN